GMPGPSLPTSVTGCNEFRASAFRSGDACPGSFTACLQAWRRTVDTSGDEASLRSAGVYRLRWIPLGKVAAIDLRDASVRHVHDGGKFMVALKSFVRAGSSTTDTLAELDRAIDGSGMDPALVYVFYDG